MVRDFGYLLDVLHEARTALEFTKGKIYADFEQDTKLQYAIIRAVEIMGEAASRVSTDFRESHPELPWREMIGMRNKMIHDYEEISLPVVWEVVERDIPELIHLIEPLIPPE